MKSLTPRQSAILTGIARDLAKWSAAKHLTCVGDRCARQRLAGYNSRIALAQDYRAVEPDAVAWLGRPQSAADRVTNCRTLAALERHGLVTRYRDDSDYRPRTVCVSLTPAGEALARRIIEQHDAAADAARNNTTPGNVAGGNWDRGELKC